MSIDPADRRPRDWLFVTGAGMSALGAVLVLGREVLGGDLSAGITGTVLLMLGAVAMLRSHISTYVSDAVDPSTPRPGDDPPYRPEGTGR